MKKHTKFLTLTLALAMLLAFALPMSVSAAGETDGLTGSITIQPPDSGMLSIERGDFTAYKLFDLIAIRGLEDPFVPYDPAVKPTSANPYTGPQFVYKPADWLPAFLAWSGNYGTDVEAFRKDLQDNRVTDDAFMVQLAKDLSLFDKAGVTPSIEINADTPQAGKNVLFSDLEYGLYLVAGYGFRTDYKPAPGRTDNEKVVTRGMLINIPEEVVATAGQTNEGKVTSHNPNPVRKLKADAPKLGDEEKPGKEVKDDDGTWGIETDRNIGDVVEYRINTWVPDMTGYDSYQFILTDTMSQGLTPYAATGTFVANGVAITLGSSVLTAGTHFTVTTAAGANGATVITITFNSFVQWKAQVGAPIEVLYSARLNKDAVIGGTGNKNSVNLTYSNDPNWDGSGTEPKGKTPDEETTVYTFEINVLKRDGKDKATTLAGAKFELYRSDASNATPIEFVATANANEYRIPDATELGATPAKITVFETDSTGALRFLGLDAGDYWLKETKAPTGYNPITSMIKVTIDHDGNVTIGDNVAAEPVIVENNTGGILPGTGGIGTYLFFIGGPLLAIVCVAVYISWKRRKTLGMLPA